MAVRFGVVTMIGTVLWQQLLLSVSTGIVLSDTSGRFGAALAFVGSIQRDSTARRSGRTNPFIKQQHLTVYGERDKIRTSIENRHSRRPRMLPSSVAQSSASRSSLSMGLQYLSRVEEVDSSVTMTRESANDFTSTTAPNAKNDEVAAKQQLSFRGHRHRYLGSLPNNNGSGSSTYGSSSNEDNAKDTHWGDAERPPESRFENSRLQKQQRNRTYNPWHRHDVTAVSPDVTDDDDDSVAGSEMLMSNPTTVLERWQVPVQDDYHASFLKVPSDYVPPPTTTNVRQSENSVGTSSYVVEDDYNSGSHYHYETKVRQSANSVGTSSYVVEDNYNSGSHYHYETLVQPYDPLPEEQCNGDWVTNEHNQAWGQSGGTTSNNDYIARNLIQQTDTNYLVNDGDAVNDFEFRNQDSYGIPADIFEKARQRNRRNNAAVYGITDGYFTEDDNDWQEVDDNSYDYAGQNSITDAPNKYTAPAVTVLNAVDQLLYPVDTQRQYKMDWYLNSVSVASPTVSRTRRLLHRILGTQKRRDESFGVLRPRLKYRSPPKISDDTVLHRNNITDGTTFLVSTPPSTNEKNLPIRKHRRFRRKWLKKQRSSAPITLSAQQQQKQWQENCRRRMQQHERLQKSNMDASKTVTLMLQQREQQIISEHSVMIDTIPMLGVGWTDYLDMKNLHASIEGLDVGQRFWTSPPLSSNSPEALPTHILPERHPIRVLAKICEGATVSDSSANFASSTANGTIKVVTDRITDFYVLQLLLYYGGQCQKLGDNSVSGGIRAVQILLVPSSNQVKNDYDNCGIIDTKSALNELQIQLGPVGDIALRECIQIKSYCGASADMPKPPPDMVLTDEWKLVDGSVNGYNSQRQYGGWTVPYRQSKGSSMVLAKSQTSDLLAFDTVWQNERTTTPFVLPPEYRWI